MGVMDGVPILLASARLTAQRFDERVSKLHDLINVNGAQTGLVNDLKMAVLELEIAVVGVFSLFEARMQHKLHTGSFYKQLKSHLVAAGQHQLARDIWHYYLAVNVLKHGLGASYQELCQSTDLPFTIKDTRSNFFDEGDVAEVEGLINVTEAGFFQGLLNALESIYSCLDN